MRFIKIQQFRLAGIITASMLVGGVMTGTAMAYQGHMFSALHALETAKYQLSVAANDKRGYRLQAIGLVDQAINAVHAGIAAGS